MSFDPNAATAAYLATLSPEAHLKATHYTQGGHWLLLWGWLVSVLVALVILKLGVLARTERGLQRRKPRPWLVAFVISLIYLALDWLFSLPWDAYSSWWREKSYGLSSQPFTGWLTENLISTVITLLFGGLFLMIIYALIRRAPRIWPLWAGVAAAIFTIFGVFIAPMFIEPLFNHYQPAPDGPVRSMVVEMGKQVGVPTDKIYIYNGSKQSNRYTANVSGLFGSARVAMSDTMFAKGADIAEVRGVVGHEMGHYVRKHILLFVPFMAVLVAVQAWLVQLLFPLLQRWLRADEVRGVADPADLPLLAILFVTLNLIATPLQNSATRLEEADADNFSLRHFNEPDGLAKALVKTIEYRADSPSKLEEVMFYDHPSVRWRVHNAMVWKATHPQTPQPAPVPTAPSAG